MHHQLLHAFEDPAEKSGADNVTHQFQIEDAHQNCQRLYKSRCDKPHGGDNDFGPDKLVTGDGQGKHHITLVAHQICAEALHHQHNGDNHQRRHADAEGEQQQPAHQIGEKALGIQQEVQRQVCRQRQNQNDEKQRSHHPGRGPEFVFDQFSQHLNTSRNSASTLMPFSSRI